MTRLKRGNEAKNKELFAVEIFISGFLLFIMFIMIPFTTSKIIYENKQTITLFIVFFIPTIIIVGVYDAAFRVHEFSKKFGNIFLVAIPLCAIYTATMNYVKKQNENIFKAILTLSGFGFSFPITITATLSYINFYDISHPLIVAAVVIFAICFLIMLVFFVVKIIWRIKQIKRLHEKFINYDLRDCGHLTNVIIGVLSMTVLIILYANTANQSTSKRSLTFGISFIVLFLTICVSAILSIQTPKGVTGHHLDL